VDHHQRVVAVPADLHLPAGRYGEADLVAFVQVPREVSAEDPVLWPIQQKVGVVGKVARLQSRRVARSQPQTQTTLEHGLGGEDLDHHSFAQLERPRREDVALAELGVRSIGVVSGAAESDVSSPGPVQHHRVEVELRGLISQERQRHLFVIPLLDMYLVHAINDPVHLFGRIVTAVRRYVAPRVVQLVANVDEFDRGGVSVNIYQGPERTPRFDTAEEDSFFFAVDSEVDVTG
jgi:hypothetical protein